MAKKYSKATKAYNKLSTGAKVLVVILIIAIVAGVIFAYMQGYLDQFLYPDNNNTSTNGSGTTTGNTTYAEITGELEIHFLELGNDYTGDSIYIKAGDVDILVDAGSRQNSGDDIYEYVDQYCTDGMLEYTIITHADQDHIAGFVGTSTVTGIFDYYDVGTIIDFPMTNKDTVVYNNYIDERTQEIAEGDDNTVCYTALQCYNETDGASRIYQLTDDITLEILYHKYYETYNSDENEYSVCFLLTHGSEKFLFTGDLEDDGEESLVETYGTYLADVTLFKAGHHGSKTSSTAELLSIISPEIVVVTCVAGSDEYTDTWANQFPTQDMIDRVSLYTDQVYVTTMFDLDLDCAVSMNGDIKVISNIDGVTVSCSNNDTILKDTEWFLLYREMPDAWGAV